MTIYKLIPIQSLAGPYFHYYTLVPEEGSSLFAQFLKKYEQAEQSQRTEYEVIIRLLMESQRKGILFPPFTSLRNERNAEALPPIGIKSQVRLYLFRATQFDIILFSGGLKTSRTAQGSIDLAQEFKLANKLCQIIQRELVSQNFQELLQSELIL